MSETVELLTRAVLIGVGGAAGMDLWGWVARRAFGVKGLDYALLGRWIGHLGRGRLSHGSIASAELILGERALGWTAHYPIGIAFALLLLVVQGLQWAHAPTLLPALLVGWATLVAPWFIMQPAMGSGFAASKTPHPHAARLRNIATHTPYGVGLYGSVVALSAA
ncbi:DUF2938 domain-containing protein [Ornithinimicrobium cryptoxanthini]|uniref:DUF2938 domain-containing protein n=1 Tax=Ornithinimicrobium cryptoxanthini TaxID=2934161 RepID=UPI0021181676|nr:DUF2938 domain-containing protein [Ornithinimicrobium cryptoxanthini]